MAGAGFRSVASLCACAWACGGSESVAPPGQDGGAGLADARPMPAGGIAAAYPGDVGIGTDPRVIFADDFETYAGAGDLDRNWDAVYHEVRIATESGNAISAPSSSADRTSSRSSAAGTATRSC